MYMKKIISHYNAVVNWAKTFPILKYFLDRKLLAERWYRMHLYKILSMPVMLIKQRNIFSRFPLTSVGITIMLAMFGLTPPTLWHDWYVFAMFWGLSVLFILKTDNARAAANHSIYLYVFIVTALLPQTQSGAGLTLLYFLAAAGVSKLIMRVISEPCNIYKILCGI